MFAPLFWYRFPNLLKLDGITCTSVFLYFSFYFCLHWTQRQNFLLLWPELALCFKLFCLIFVFVFLSMGFHFWYYHLVFISWHGFCFVEDYWRRQQFTSYKHVYVCGTKPVTIRNICIYTFCTALLSYWNKGDTSYSDRILF